jgi:hypothetical protein
MQAVLVVLAVAGSTAWLAVDASKRDWTDNGFAKNVPTWVVGSLLLWPIVLLLYVFSHRKKAPLLAAPEPAPAAAMSAAEPAEQYGPSLDEVEPEEPVVEPEPEPVLDISQPEPHPAVEVVEFQPEQVVTPQVVAEPDPVVEFHTESVVEVNPGPVVEIRPEPVVEIEPEPVSIEPVPFAPEPHPVAIEPEPFTPEPDPFTPEPDPVVPEPEPSTPEPEPGPVIEAGPEPDGVLEISYPALADEAPPGLSVDAFKDMKPVAFGGIVVEETERTPDPAPAPEVEPQPEPVLDVHPEPIVEAEPPRDFEPLTYPGVEDVPPVEPEVQAEPEPAFEPEPEMAAAVAEPVVDEQVLEDAKPKRRGFRIPNPELRLPSFGKKTKAEPSVKTGPKSKGALKLPQITLPANLQGPLDDVERKIALGCVLAIVAAGALGYKTAPSDDAGTPAPSPTPAAASR